MANSTEPLNSKQSQPCSFKYHEFCDKISDNTIKFHIIKMENCLYLWIGDAADNKMGDLSLAFISNLKKEPITTKIMGTVTDTTSVGIARRLSMKLGKPVYVSFNATLNNSQLSWVEKRIQNEFEKCADFLNF